MINAPGPLMREDDVEGIIQEYRYTAATMAAERNQFEVDKQRLAADRRRFQVMKADTANLESKWRKATAECIEAVETLSARSEECTAFMEEIRRKYDTDYNELLKELEFAEEQGLKAKERNVAYKRAYRTLAKSTEHLRKYAKESNEYRRQQLVEATRTIAELERRLNMSKKEKAKAKIRGWWKKLVASIPPPECPPYSYSRRR